MHSEQIYKKNAMSLCRNRIFILGFCEKEYINRRASQAGYSLTRSAVSRYFSYISSL